MAEEVNNRNNKPLVIVLAVLCILVVGFAIGNLAIIFINNPEISTTENENSSEPNSEESNIIESDKEFLVNELNEYIASTNESIADTSSDEEKAVLYVTMAASIYDNNEQLNDPKFQEQMLSYVYKAEELYPTASTAYNIYVYENALGNKEKADYYYNLAIERGYIEEEGNG